MKTIWYMGVKSRLIPGFIDTAIDELAPRGATVLDIFSGSAAVATALAAKHRVVANDVQRYAGAIARGYLCHDANVLEKLDPRCDLEEAFLENAKALAEPLREALALEDGFIAASGLEREEGWAFGKVRARTASVDDYRAFALEGTPLFSEEHEARFEGVFEPAKSLLSRASVLERRREPAKAPYLLATAYYPNVYLGIRQAIETDSLRYAIDRIPASDPHAATKRAHYLAALLHALSVTTSATSHFCQPRGLTSAHEVHAVLTRRAASIVARTLAFSQDIAATVREVAPRPGNLVTSCDWRDLFSPRGWAAPGIDASVVYIDPPYTADNYSRFYHLLEVVTDYDYPPLEASKGRYPSIVRRHQSAFCRRAKVEGEFRDLFAACARSGASVVVSYAKESGLLLRRYREDEQLDEDAALERFCDLARASFGSVSVRERRLQHSGQGDSNKEVTELLLVGRAGRRRARVTRARERASRS